MLLEHGWKGLYSSGFIRHWGKNIQLERLIEMGFDGAATFSGNKTGVQ